MTRLQNYSSLLVALFTCACSVESFSADREAPRVTSVIPTTLRAENGMIEILFSEPVINVKNMETCLRFAKSAEVSESTLKRVAKSKNAETVAPFLPIAVTLSESHDKITVVPPAKLGYTESYSLWIFDCLRDHAGNALEMLDPLLGLSEYRFQVEDGPFVLLSHDVVLPGESSVAPNRKYFHFRFSHPISKLPSDALRLDDRIVESRLGNDKRTIVAIISEALVPGVSHQFVFGTGIEDNLHRLLPAQTIPFQTEAQLRSQEAQLIHELKVLSYETHVDLSFRAMQLETARLRYSRMPPNWEGELSSAVGIFRIDGLEALASYEYELEVENLFGQREVVTGHFDLKAVASIALNEILANPKLKKGEPDASGEFIELFNFGDSPIDISGFSIEVSGKTCALVKKKEQLIVPAKSYILIVGKKFDPAHFSLSDSPAIWRVPRQSICGNLRNWPLPNIVLRDETGRQVDQFLGMPVRKEKGVSVERLNPSEKNGKEKYCYSRSDVGPTPLRANGVAEKGCENS